MKLSQVVIFCLVGIIVVSLLIDYQQQKNQPKQTQSLSPTTTQSVLGVRTKSSGCEVNGPLPDPLCTPGKADPALTKDVLCSSSFSTRSIRNVSTQEKHDVYDEYGIMSHTTGEYEVDHLISLELGGSNDIANLWPEAAEPRPGFHEKDQVENYLHQQVCSGAITLPDAQQQIAHNWLQIYQSMPK